MRRIFVVLAVALAISLAFNGYFMLFYKGCLENNPDETWTETFNFWWSPEEQNVTSGVLWMNITFKTLGENLSITVKINDDSHGILIMVFDRNRNGKIDYGRTKDIPYHLMSNNRTMTPLIGVEPKGNYIVPSVMSRPSPWHACTYNNVTGLRYCKV